MHALDGFPRFFESLQFHIHVDSTDHEYAIYRFHFTRYIGGQTSFTRIDLARFQRAPEGSDHSPTGSRNDVIQGRGVRVSQLARIDAVVFSDVSVNAELHRPRLSRKLRDTERTFSPFYSNFGDICDFSHVRNSRTENGLRLPVERIKDVRLVNRKTAILLLFILSAGSILAQQPAPPGSARESARVDLTGYWVSLITEEWMYRSTTPKKGDYTAVPLNPDGRRVADSWDPARDAAAGDQCKPFGAAGLMRLPLRVHITWADDNTLKLETDAGQQMRLFLFGDRTQAGRTVPAWQGYSVAKWSTSQGPPVASGGGGGRGARGGAPAITHGSLEVVTRNLRPGYLRRNGVPYSEKTLLTEYYDRISAFTNDYIVVTTVVEDPVFLTVPFITTSHFKKEPDGSKWDPTPCGGPR